MNVSYPQQNPITARTCSCKGKNKQSVTYAFSEEFHSLCMDKRYIIEAEIEACERLFKYCRDNSEKAVIEREISELKVALDLMR